MGAGQSRDADMATAPSESAALRIADEGLNGLGQCAGEYGFFLAAIRTAPLGSRLSRRNAAGGLEWLLAALVRTAGSGSAVSRRRRSGRLDALSATAARTDQLLSRASCASTDCGHFRPLAALPRCSGLELVASRAKFG